MTPEQELWACALHLQRVHGDDAPHEIAVRITDLASRNDAEGVARWKAIAFRYDLLAADVAPH